MKVIKSNKIKDCEKKITESIKKGKVMVLPFDTVYGLVADPFNADAVDKIFKIKGRDFNKPIALIFSSIEMLKKYINLDKKMEKFVLGKIPGRYTFIMPWKESSRKLFSPHYQKLEKIGIRIPDYRFIFNCLEVLGQPIAATSANVSGNDNCWSVDDFLQQIDSSDFKPDIIIDGGKLAKKPPSEVIDISNLNNITVLRKSP